MEIKVHKGIGTDRAYQCHMVFDTVMPAAYCVEYEQHAEYDDRWPQTTYLLRWREHQVVEKRTSPAATER